MSAQPRRIRLKPWLVAQVDSGRYPGLQWLTPELRLFQIPWRHATRHMPMSEEENTIFKAWALETGKYQEGVDEPDPAKWKANLRCALNKSREFKLVYDGTKETPVNPYKHYEVCDQPGNGDTVDEDEEEMPNLVDLTIHPRTSEVPAYLHFPAGLANGGLVPGPPLGEMPPMPSLSAVVASAVSVPPPSGGMGMDTGPVPMDTCPMVGMQTQGEAQAQAQAEVQPGKYDLLSSLPLTDLDLKFQYRGRTTRSQTVSNPQGCRLYYGHLEPTPGQVDLFGPVTLQQVAFPGASEVQNHKQRLYTEALLDVMDRGLILELIEEEIYAVRLCQCRVFWSGPGAPERSGAPNPMERERRIRVFSLNQFLEGLIRYQKGDTLSPPPFEVYFCFGEDWPDKKPKEKKLIIVQVVPVVARILTEMFSGELDWSTDSIRLQISNPDVKDRTVEQFKEVQRLLQSQRTQQGPWGPPHVP